MIFKKALTFNELFIAIAVVALELIGIIFLVLGAYTDSLNVELLGGFIFIWVELRFDIRETIREVFKK